MPTLNVLFTNNTLAGRAGSETYVRDVALALLRRGHRPVAFSLVLGEIAEELREATVPVIDDLARLGTSPDVIHGHHHLETFMAALAFPTVPVVHFCHGWLPWEELPLQHPSVRRYVAIDEVCRDRLVLEEGVAPGRVELLLNFVDLARFRPRAPLPPRPARALILSNSATEEGYARAIRTACDARGITVDVAGMRAGRPLQAPESVFGEYEVVFAKARTALEAMATGCAVVLADASGCGPIVTPTNFARLRSHNFGIRELSHSHDPKWYAEQLAAYDAGAGDAVSARVRVEAGLEAAVDRLLEIYADAMATPAQGDPGAAGARQLRRLAVPFKNAFDLSVQLQHRALEAELARAERDRTQIDLTAAREQAERTALDLTAARDRAHAYEREIAAFRALPSMRLRDALLRVPLVGSALRSSARTLTRRLPRDPRDPDPGDSF